MPKENDFVVDYQRVLITLSLLKNVEDSDYTEKHSLKVGRISKSICEELGFDIKKTNLITRSAYFHDVGKIKLSRKVLFKAGRLDDEEYEEMKQHPIYSCDILISLGLEEEAKIALQHHERLDGSGYPRGLEGDEITIGARIILIADVFDSMTSDRPYRRGLRTKDVLLHLYYNINKFYDPEIVKALHRVLEKDKKIKNTLDI